MSQCPLPRALTLRYRLRRGSEVRLQAVSVLALPVSTNTVSHVMRTVTRRWDRLAYPPPPVPSLYQRTVPVSMRRWSRVRVVPTLSRRSPSRPRVSDGPIPRRPPTRQLRLPLSDKDIPP